LPGRRAVCQRNNYASMSDGNQEEIIGCCLRDYNFVSRFSERPCLTNAHLISGIETTTNDDSLCFVLGSNRTRTCHPKHRSVTTTECQDALFDYCLGVGVGFDEWASRWCAGSNLPICVQIIMRNLVGNPEPYYNDFAQGACHSGTFTPTAIPSSAYNNRDGFLWSTKVITAAYKRFKSEGYDLASEVYHPLEDVFYTLFRLAPGISEDVLKDFCSDKSINDLTSDEATLKYCGCYLPDEEYGEYLTNYGINKECTPTCSRLDVIPLSKPDGVSKLHCTQTVCVIDDVTIDLINSSAGTISFANICGGCGSDAGSSCVCYTLDTTVEEQDSKVGNISEVDCSTKKPVAPLTPDAYLSFFNRIPQWVLIMLFGVVAAILIFLIFKHSN